MTKRRELLKVISAAGATGAIWSKPVVESVVLPAHALTSEVNSEQSGITEGCYEVFEAEDPEAQSFSWPGGFGPHDIETMYESSDCSGSTFPGQLTVVSENEQNAEVLLSCNDVYELTSSGLPTGLSFWGSDC